MIRNGEKFMSKKNVGIIFGGKSSEHEVSLQSAKNIVEAIDRSMYNVVLIGINKVGEWHLYDEAAYLLNADDPKNIKLNPSNIPVALTLGDTGGNLVHITTGELVGTIDIA